MMNCGFDTNFSQESVDVNSMKEEQMPATMTSSRPLCKQDAIAIENLNEDNNL